MIAQLKQIAQPLPNFQWQDKASIIILFISLSLSLSLSLYPTFAREQFTIAQPKSTLCPTPAIVLNFQNSLIIMVMVLVMVMVMVKIMVMVMVMVIVIVIVIVINMVIILLGIK